jgi:hypothetical protein
LRECLLSTRALSSHGVDRPVDGGEDGASVVEEALARGEQRHPARRPGEERGPELLFERADLTAERRLRDVQALRGAADVPFLRDGNEVTDLREAHGRSMGRAGHLRKTRGQIKRVLDLLRSLAA